jgi:ribosomal protein L12E/L44/L45/RPP1/RPP2
MMFKEKISGRTNRSSTESVWWRSFAKGLAIVAMVNVFLPAAFPASVVAQSKATKAQQEAEKKQDNLRKEEQKAMDAGRKAHMKAQDKETRKRMKQTKKKADKGNRPRSWKAKRKRN